MTAPDLPGKTRFLWIATGTLLLLLPAILNGYPLLNPDDNTYLLSGFLPETPFDRPITYGLLLRVLSLNGLSLFAAAFFQSLIMAVLVVGCTRQLCPDNHRAGWLLLPVLALLSPLSWLCSELLPDVFTGIAFLSLVLILLPATGKHSRVWLYVLYTASVATHVSHVMIFLILLTGVLLFRKYLFEGALRRVAMQRSFLALFLTLATIATMGSAISKSRSVFGVASLLEKGILKPYLDEHCPVEPYQLCRWKDSLPANGDLFLWDPRSPLYQTGGWAANKKEYGRIVNGSYSEPEYLGMHLKTSLLFTGRQLLAFRTGDGNFPVARGSELLHTVAKYVPRDTTLLLQARQQRASAALQVGWYNVLIYGTVIVSVLLLLVISFRQRLPPGLKLFALLVPALILVNAWCCATFSQVNARYQCRVIWLLPMVAIYGWAWTMKQRKKERRPNSS